MHDEQPANLRIVTSMATAIKLHNLTHYNSFSGKGNDFLHRAGLDFQSPVFNKATFHFESYAPESNWFALFDDAEKEIMEDSYAFYGISYATSVKLALKRLERLIEKVEAALVGKVKPEGNETRSYDTRSDFYHRDYLKEIETALKKFSEADQITLTFIFSEWPDIEEAKRRDYVNEFEKKLMKKLSQTTNLPF